MNIVVESGNTSNNWGDFSMLYSSVERLHISFPKSEIYLIGHPNDSNYTSVDAIHLDPKGRKDWFLHYGIGGALRSNFSVAVDTIYRHAPRLLDSLTHLKNLLKRQDTQARDAFMSVFNDADLFIISGMGGINDNHTHSCHRILSLINMAHAKNIPVALVSQGIGPIHNTTTQQKAYYTLPKAKLIGLRERKYSLPLLRKIGCPEKRILVTGDDAIALAHSERSSTLGNSIGVNLQAGYSDHTVDLFSNVLKTVASSVDASLDPIPIQHEGANSDVPTISRILKQCGEDSDGGASLATLTDVFHSVSKCRVVVTARYHGGVFALSQGIPVVAIYRNEYYEHKFNGLADQFGTGCKVINAEGPNLSHKLSDAIHSLWADADDLRPILVSAARNQIRYSKKLYRQLKASLYKH